MKLKLKSSGVFVAILILIIMMLICHSMNFFYPKNNFKDISTKNNKNTPSPTPINTYYNEIYYTNESDEKQLCANVNQAEIPCDIVRICKTEPVPTPIPKPTLSHSEMALLYKVAYNESAREILTRTIKDMQPTPTLLNSWDF